MGWSQENLKRGYVCNHELVKFFRKIKGWPQQHLAEVAVVSVRVVCKAESGESISTASIEKLANALSRPNQTVHPEDLISFPIETCREFVTDLHQNRHRVVDMMEDKIEKDAVFRVTGDPERIPFAGVHHGVTNYRLALKKFFEILEYAPDFDYENAYEFYPSGTEVVVWGNARLRPFEGDREIRTFAHRRLFRFRRGRLFALEDQYDLEQGGQMVDAAKAVLGDKVFTPPIDSRF